MAGVVKEGDEPGGLRREVLRRGGGISLYRARRRTWPGAERRGSGKAGIRRRSGWDGPSMQGLCVSGREERMGFGGRHNS
jgi:hypothetical protein